MICKKSSIKHLALYSTSLLFAVDSLGADSIKLEEVSVVSAAGYEQKITDAPASISVITKEDLQKKSYTNLLDAVRDIEGVDIGESTDKSGQGTVSIRGMGADYTLVLVDGKKQNNNGDIYPNNFGGLQFANIPPLSMIERIEVIRGPMSTLYGADAMGGVINIITKKISNEWTGSIAHGRTFHSKSHWGNENTTDVAIMGPLIENKLGLSLRGSFYDKEESKPQWESASYMGASSFVNSKGVTKPYSKSNDSFGSNGKTMDNQNWTAGAGLTFTPNENHTLKADFDISKQKYDNTKGSVGTVDSYETLYNNQRVGYAPIQRMQREQYSINWEAFWENGKSTVGIHHIKSENLGRSLPLSAAQRTYIAANKAGWGTLAGAMADPVFVAMMPRPVRTLESSNTTYDAKYELPLDNHYLVVGTQYLEAELKDGVFGMEKGGTNKKKKYSQYSFFAEDNWDVLEMMGATYGARYDKHENFGSHVSPRAYLTYALNSSWTLKGGVATGYKTPKTTDLQEGITGFGSQGTSPMFGNPDLKPEKSLSKEIAAYYEHENRHNFNITLFENSFKDKIESTDIPIADVGDWGAFVNAANPPKQKQNVGKASIKGLELSGKYLIIDDLSLKANWTYMKSKIKSDDSQKDGKPLTSSPKHMYNITLDWQTTPKFNTYLQYSAEVDRFKQRYQKAGANQDLYYKDYSIWNLGASYKLDKNITFNGRINNLFDKDFMKYEVVDRVGDTIYYSEYSNISSNRSFWMNVVYTF